jgi:putative ABC transport system permease protein
MTNEQWPFVDSARWLVARAKADAATLAPAVRDAIWRVDKDQPIVRVNTMDRLVAQSEAQRQFALILFEAFGLVALALAGAGIYGLLSGSVTERTREIGVRAALGASRADILAWVVRQGMMLTLVGVAAGLVATAAVSRQLVALLYGISPLDPLTYAGVAMLLVAVAAIACAVPARRAARIDPLRALRCE